MLYFGISGFFEIIEVTDDVRLRDPARIRKLWLSNNRLCLFFGWAMIVVSLAMIAGAAGLAYLLVPPASSGDHLVLAGAVSVTLAALGFILMGREFIKTAFRDPLYGCLKRPAEYGFAPGEINKIEYHAGGGDGACLFSGVYKSHSGEDRKTGGGVDGRLGRLLLAESKRNHGRLPPVKAWFIFLIDPPPEDENASFSDMPIVSALAGIPKQTADELRNRPQESGGTKCLACGQVFAGQTGRCPYCGSPAGSGVIEKLARLFRPGRKEKEAEPEDEDLVKLFAGDQAAAELLTSMLNEEGVPAFVKSGRGAPMPEFAVFVERKDAAEANSVFKDFMTGSPDSPGIPPENGPSA